MGDGEVEAEESETDTDDELFIDDWPNNQK